MRRGDFSRVSSDPAGYSHINTKEDDDATPPSPPPYRNAFIGVLVFAVLFLAWAIAVTAVFGSYSSVCGTASTCSALGLPASECDTTGGTYSSTCATSADCSHVDTCCSNETGTRFSACSSKDHYSCQKNDSTSTHGACKAASNGNTQEMLDLFTSQPATVCTVNNECDATAIERAHHDHPARPQTQ